MNLVSKILDSYSDWFNKKKKENALNEGAYYRLIAIERFEINPEGIDLYFIANQIIKSKPSVSTKLVVRLENLHIEEDNTKGFEDNKDRFVSPCNWRVLKS